MEKHHSPPEQVLPEAVKRRPRGRPRITPHPTATLLLDTAVELLDTVPLEGLTTMMVLERCGVSIGSLYHHYEDISDLIEQAVVHRYSRNLKASLQAVRDLLGSSDAAEFKLRVEQILDESIKPERRPNRLERIEVLGALRDRPRLVARIARAQQEITDEQAALFAEFQQRGWTRPDVDPGTISAFVQAVIVGRIVDDVSERPIDHDQWSQVALRAFRAILFVD
jgi:AcrR family transcriptional regulator